MENQNEFEIDLLELFHYLKKKLWIILASFAACAVLGFVVSAFFITPEYTASTRVYVLNRSNETSVVSSDFTLSNYMISDYKVLITGKNVTDEVENILGLDKLTASISVSAESNTRILQISVTDTDPQRAANIANTVREVASTQIKEIMDVDAVNLVYAAEVPKAPSSPNVMRNTVLAAALGMIAAIGVLAVIFILDDTIRTEEDVEKYLGLGTMGVIPASSELGSAARQTGGRAKPAPKK